MHNLVEFLIYIKNKFSSSRIAILGMVGLICVIILLARLYDLQIVNGEQYQTNYIQKAERTISLQASRGNIYDRNGNILAYNELAYDISIRDNGDYKTNIDKNSMILRLVKILEKHDESIIGEMPITVDDLGNYSYNTTSDAQLKRFLRSYYGLKSNEELDDASGKHSSRITAAEIIAEKSQTYKIDQTVDRYGNLVEMTPYEILQVINIRYTMSLTAYKKYESTVVSKDVSENTRSEILESSSEILGVEVEESAKRVYNDAIYFSSIIGYVGKVQENQLEELQKTDSEYDLNDTVGRIGIEEYMESYLKGSKGSRTMYVDNMGRIMEITAESSPSSGNDVYLTLDRDLQVGTYRLLEQNLAGILASKLVIDDNPNEKISDTSKWKIPITKAYYQLINNNILSTQHFRSENASNIEKGIDEKRNSYMLSQLDLIKNELLSDNASITNDLPNDLQEYMSYVYSILSQQDSGIINSDAIDTNLDYYKSWQDGTISLREYIKYGIEDNWIITSNLNIDSKYSDSEEIYNAIASYVIDYLQKDSKFEKLNYKYLITNHIVTGRELCIALLDQGILDSDDEERSNLESNAENYAFSYFKNKVNKIELTPAQLALDPCTAGCVVTDVETGEVLALVSYPGYDNNKLTNTMDVEYYNSLLNDQSLPLYNNATQTQKAPGSVFKPITAVAGLEEGVIDQYGTIECTGLYDTIDPAIRCWIYPGRHGILNTTEGLQNSCNYFFAEIGHRLSLDDDGNYDQQQGLNILSKYATMFGLDHKSGVEINETEPHISDEGPERSSIGQGSNSFTNVQLSRYVTAIANKGNVYELSILNKVTDADGNIVMNYSPTLSSKIDLKESTWDIVHRGMRQVIEFGSAQKLFEDLEVDIAGKTGTPQESKSRANHATFISFGPYTNPQIAVTVNIPYGYSSSNAAAAAKDVYRLYFGYMTLDYIENNQALDATNITIGD